MSRRYRNPNKGKKGQRMSKTKQKQSNRFHKARIQVARQHLDISRQRKDFVVKTARCVIQSNDLVAYVGKACAKRIDLLVRNMVKKGTLLLQESVNKILRWKSKFILWDEFSYT